MPEPLPPLAKLNQLASDILAKTRRRLPETLARIKDAEQAVENAQRAVHEARTPAGVAEYAKRERGRLNRELWTGILRAARFILLLVAFYMWSRDHYWWAILLALAFASSE